MLSQFEKKLNELENYLDHEKNSKDRFSVKLASKDALVAEVQEKLEASQSNKLRVEDDLPKSKEEIIQLKGHLSDLNTQRASATIAPVVLKVQERQKSESDAPKTEAESPNPAASIDWVLKKKSQ